jgi:hypothetical protein
VAIISLMTRIAAIFSINPNAVQIMSDALFAAIFMKYPLKKLTGKILSARMIAIKNITLFLNLINMNSTSVN